MLNVINILLETEDGIVKVVMTQDQKKDVMEFITKEGLKVKKLDYLGEWVEE